MPANHQSRMPHTLMGRKLIQYGSARSSPVSVYAPHHNTIGGLMINL
jgi:hypothetical protein